MRGWWCRRDGHHASPRIAELDLLLREGMAVLHAPQMSPRGTLHDALVYPASYGPRNHADHRQPLAAAHDDRELGIENGIKAFEGGLHFREQVGACGRQPSEQFSESTVGY